MRFLVAGGAGFIGSHLCERLLNEGHEVVCLDNLRTGSLANVAELRERQGFEFTRGDVCDPLDLAVDVIAHLASPASPLDYAALPVETMLANSQGTLNLLDLARNRGARFLFASTSEVYGDPQVSPQSEDYFGNVNPVGARSCYDESKRFGEALTFTYIRKYGVQATIMRIFNTFGPRMRREDGRAVPNFINQALAGEPLTIYGDGTQTRSFCYVDDLVEGITRMLLRDDLGGEIINLGTDEEMTILALAEKVKELTGSSSGFSYASLPEDDPLIRKPDLTRARSILGWEARVSLEEGLRRLVDWFTRTSGGSGR